MRLDEYIEDLVSVELSQHTWGDRDTAGNIEKLPRLISLINQGVQKLHSVLMLKKGVVFLCLDGRRRYVIEEGQPYLEGEDCPLYLLEILQVISCCGKPVRLNAIHRYPPDNQKIEVFMTNKNTLEFNECKGKFRIIYRRGVPPIIAPNEKHQWNARDYEIDLPDSHLDLLTYWICSRLFIPITPTDGNAAQFSPAHMYKAKYTEELDRLRGVESFEIDGMDNWEQRFDESGMP